MRALVFLAATLGASAAFPAGFIEQACLSTQKAHPGLCACTQSAANQTLSAADQQTAAEMIISPDLYYEYAESGKQAKLAFIDRYEIWGDAISTLCTVEG